MTDKVSVDLYLENFIQKEILNKINILIKTSENNKPNDLQINVNKFERTLRANESLQRNHSFLTL